LNDAWEHAKSFLVVLVDVWVGILQVGSALDDYLGCPRIRDGCLSDRPRCWHSLSLGLILLTVASWRTKLSTVRLLLARDHPDDLGQQRQEIRSEQVGIHWRVGGQLRNDVVLLVLLLLLLTVSNLFQLVVRDLDDSTLFDLLVVQQGASLGSLIRRLEADKSMDALAILFGLLPLEVVVDDLYALDLSESAEKPSYALPVEVRRQILDKQVALLLRVLEAYLLALNLSFALVTRNRRLNIELVAVELLVMKVSNSLLSCLKTVSGVILSIEANKGKRALNSILLALLALDDGATDIAVLRENLNQLFFGPSRVEILHIDVVPELL